MCDVDVITTQHFPLRAGSGSMVFRHSNHSPDDEAAVTNVLPAKVRRSYLLVILISRGRGKFAIEKKIKLDDATLSDVIKEAKKQGVHFIRPTEGDAPELWRQGCQPGGRGAFYEELETNEFG